KGGRPPFGTWISAPPFRPLRPRRRHGPGSRRDDPLRTYETHEGRHMDHRPVPRSADDFQQPLSADEIRAVSRTAFGSNTEVVSAVELAGGYYNTTYCVHLSHERPVVLRVSPAPARHGRADPEPLRNEY